MNNYSYKIIYLVRMIIVVGLLLQTTNCYSETLFNQVVIERDEYFGVPAFNISDYYNSFTMYDVTNAKLLFWYKGFNCGIHDNGAYLGVLISFNFRDVDWNPAYEAHYSLLMFPEYSEDGNLELLLDDEYFEQVVCMTNQWIMTVVYEILIEEYDHPFPKNPGFDKVVISMIVEGTIIPTSNEDTSIGYIKALYR